MLMHTRSRSLLVPSAAAAVAFVTLLGHAAPAGADEPSDMGYDVGFPHCGGALPPAPGFGIVGVNGGRVFNANPCLEAQLVWARNTAYGSPVFYANTGNPGPAYSPFWPIGQTSPRVCDAGAPNSSNCSFDYGWNGAKDSFANAVRAIANVDGVDEATAQQRAAQAKWWLDVEILNSWQTLEAAYGPSWASKWKDVYALTGAVRALWDAGVTVVGIYSTQYQWNAITGGSDYTHDWFSANPVWLAGYSEATAPSGCSASSFTGGHVVMTQYPRDGFDANYLCPL
jgi:hypothetical protein